MTRASRQAVVVMMAAVLACLGATADAAVPRPAPKPPPPRISLAVSAELRAKLTVSASGRVTPAPANGTKGRLVLEFRENGRWRALGGSEVRHGKFAVVRSLPPRTGALRVRALLFEDGLQVTATRPRRVPVRDRRPKRPAPQPAPVPAPAPLGDPLSEASLMATVRSYASLPNHLSGTANSAAALAEINAQLAAAGLQLGQQAFTYPGFLPTEVALSAGAASVPAAAIAPLLYSGVTPPGGVSGTLFDGGNGVFDKSLVAGKIVVVSIAYPGNSKGQHLESAIELAVQGGAKGLVAVTQGVADYPKWQDVNARTGTGPLPVLMVGKVSGAPVIAAAEAAQNGSLTLTANTATGCDRDVWGELEGAEPGRRVFVGVPASSFTPSASEHGTGVAILLALARHYAAIPKSQRPETLVFIAVGGHEIGWLGLQALMASSHASWFTDADAYVHLGSALGAPAAEEEPSGAIKIFATPDPSGRLHNSENPLLDPAVGGAFAAAGVPTANVPPFTASGGEQTYAFAAGIPIASFSGASLFFHTAGDLPAAVAPAILANDAEAFRRTVDTITAIPPGQLRAENTLAAQHGSEIDPAERAPNNPTLGAGGPLGTGGEGGPAATPVAQCP